MKFKSGHILHHCRRSWHCIISQIVFTLSFLGSLLRCWEDLNLTEHSISLGRALRSDLHHLFHTQWLVLLLCHQLTCSVQSYSCRCKSMDIRTWRTSAFVRISLQMFLCSNRSLFRLRRLRDIELQLQRYYKEMKKTWHKYGKSYPTPTLWSSGLLYDNAFVSRTSMMHP